MIQKQKFVDRLKRWRENVVEDIEGRSVNGDARVNNPGIFIYVFNESFVS